MHHFRLLLIVAILLLPTQLTAATLAATLPPLAGLVAMLDEQGETFCLLPAAADPHHFQLQPRTIERLARADLLLRASFDDGGWPLPARHRNTLDLWPERDHGWLSPQAVRDALPRIASALIALQPARKAEIEAQLEQALAEVAAIAAEWRQATAPLRQSGVVMQHPAWKRLMQELAVPLLAVLESGHHGHEHGPHALDEALHDLERHPGALLLRDAAHINKSLNWLQHHAHGTVRAAEVDALGSCGMPWNQLMRNNLSSIRKAMAQ